MPDEIFEVFFVKILIFVSIKQIWHDNDTKRQFKRLK